MVRSFGILWLWLIIPLTLVFISYWEAGRETRILVSFGLVFPYMLVELLLNYVFNADFRSNAITHVPYFILEYVALFSLIAIAFDIGQTWVMIVAICFWILMGSLVYLYWEKIFKKN